MPSLTVENYVKAIFNLCPGNGEARATTGQLAAALSVSPGTVTSMLKTLSEGGLATYTPYEGVQLTGAGRELALRIVRRHRLIELFLTKALDLDWDEVHEDAEQMEHVISDALVERIDVWLGRPKVDPHGDPIPAADGTLSAPETCRLADCPCGTRFCLSRVVDQSPEFLRYLRQSGIGLGSRGELLVNRPEAGIITIRIGPRETTLGREAALNLLVTAEPAQPGPIPSPRGDGAALAAHAGSPIGT